MLVWSLLLWSSVSWSAVTSSESEGEDDSQLMVQTTHGWLRGSYTTTRGGRRVRQFLGIPYAKSPTGQRSFKSPEPVDPWDGVKNATTECDLCIQQFTMVEATRYSVLGSEDCLCMNVFVPETTRGKDKLPCVFYIFGSAYTGLQMRKIFYGPEMLLDKDICLVVPSYRLGIAGFLSTEDDVIPGNFGLKDQALALSWVKQNIHHFGGNPDSITVMGESSGAGSAHLQLYSPLTRDLFHRVIIESGSGLCFWGFSEPGEHTKKAKRLAELLECPFSPSSKFLACLQALPMSKIVNKTVEFMVSDGDPVAFFNPVIESNSVKNAFLTKNPYRLTSTKPLLAGYNYAEGMMKVAGLTSGDVNRKFKEWNEHFNHITPYRLLYYNRAKDLDDVTKKVRKFYFDNKVVKPDMMQEMVEVCGDFWFIQGLIDAVERHRGPKWLYHFNYNTTVSVCSNTYNNPLYAGACHLDELMFLFPMNITTDNFINKASSDYEMSTKMVNLWTNFITHSVPTAEGITWNPVNSSALEYLDITNSGFAMKKNHIDKRRKFWKSLNLAEKSTEDITVYH